MKTSQKTKQTSDNTFLPEMAIEFSNAIRTISHTLANHKQNILLPIDNIKKWIFRR